MNNIQDTFSAFQFLSLKIQTKSESYVDFISDLPSNLHHSQKIGDELSKSLLEFFGEQKTSLRPFLTCEMKTVSVLVIDFFQNAKGRLTWMNDKMSENLRQVAFKSKRFKRFLQVSSFMSDVLETFIRSELMRFWVWASAEDCKEERVEEVDVLKGDLTRFRGT